MRVCLLTAVCLLVGPFGTARAQLNRYFGIEQTARALAEFGLDDRIAAAQALGQEGPSELAARHLAAALSSEQEFLVRDAILESLVRRAEPESVPALRAAMGRDVRALRSIAAAGLGRIATPDAIEALVNALDEEGERDADFARVLISVIERIGEPALEEVRRSFERRATAPVILALGRLRDRQSVPALIALVAAAPGPLRVAAIESLAEIGDLSAADGLLTLLLSSDVEEHVRALGALRTIATSNHVDAIAARVDASSLAERTAALRALCAIDVEVCVPRIAAVLDSDATSLAQEAADIALISSDARMLPIQYGILKEGSQIGGACSALAESEEGGGLGILLHELEAGTVDREVATGALAVLLRRWSSELPRRAVRQSLHALDSEGPRGLALRALARDPSVRGDLIRAFDESSDPSERAWAAYGMELYGAASFERRLERALREETDPEAFRRTASALASCSAEIDPTSMPRSALQDSERAPEAMVALAPGLYRAPPAMQNELRRHFRRALARGDIRSRVAAALALALSRDRAAIGVLITAAGDSAFEVRHAAARALHFLGVDGSHRDAVDALYWLEEDERIQRELKGALDEEARPGTIAATGDEVLRFRIVTPAATPGSSGGLVVDLLLPDSRWMRIRTLSTGELFLPGLPSGEADLRVLDL